MNIQDVVRVKPLDFDDVELPEDKDKKSNATKVIKALKAFEGEHFLVQRISEIEDKTLLKLWND